MKTLADLIKDEAAQCVKCGLCLPHCPTYVKTQHEGESPRGRIALLQGLAQQQLHLTSKTQQYLDHCLSCRACEAVCPAHVRYGELFTHGQAFITEKERDHAIFRKFILWLLPKLFWARKKYPQHPQAKVAVLPGCIHTFIEKNLLSDILLLLEHVGIYYHVLNTFKCCGGLHLHAGDNKTAEKLKTQNTFLFEHFETVLSTATGCTTVLYEQCGHKVKDITAFLNQFNFSLRPLYKKIQLHSPCTLKNVLQQENIPEQLLKKIPGLEITTLVHPHCCGASGTYFLEYPTMAKKLAADIIEEVKLNSPDIFVTSNVGCAIHLTRQFKKQGLNIPIIHPVTLLAAQLVSK